MPTYGQPDSSVGGEGPARLKRLQSQVYWRTMLLGRAGGVRRDFGGSVTSLHQPIHNQVLFDLFTTDIGKHFPINLNAWGKGLPTLGFHFPTESGVLDDVLFGVRQIVFRENGAHAAAPTAMSLQKGGNLRFFHDTTD